MNDRSTPRAERGVEGGRGGVCVLASVYTFRFLLIAAMLSVYTYKRADEPMRGQRWWMHDARWMWTAYAPGVGGARKEEGRDRETSFWGARSALCGVWIWLSGVQISFCRSSPSPLRVVACVLRVTHCITHAHAMAGSVAYDASRAPSAVLTVVVVVVIFVAVAAAA